MRAIRKVFLACALSAALSACGQGGGGGGEQVGDPRFASLCNEIADDAAVFGRDMAGEWQEPMGAMVSDCRWSSEDGVMLGEAVFYTEESLRADADNPTPADLIKNMKAKWDDWTETEPRALAGIGDEAVMYKDMPGYQAQVVLRKGDVVALVLASSGDARLASAELAERLAGAVAGKIGAPS